MNKLLKLSATLLAVAITVGTAWYGLQAVQLARADALLDKANGHISQANDRLSGLGIDTLGSGDFGSVKSINEEGAAATAAAPLLEAARGDADAAAAAVKSAQDLLCLPAWYRDYLAIKAETAGLRSQQTQILAQKTEILTHLYTAGGMIFTAIGERDRLMGQFQTGYGMIKDDPATARDLLATVSQGLRAIESQLGAAYQEQGFSLLNDLADSTADYTELVEAAREVADAAIAQDQARIQDSSAELEIRLQKSGIEIGFVDAWWQNQVAPLENSYQELQTRQEELDAEAAVIYNRERRPAA